MPAKSGHSYLSIFVKGFTNNDSLLVNPKISIYITLFALPANSCQGYRYQQY